MFKLDVMFSREVRLNIKKIKQIYMYDPVCILKTGHTCCYTEIVKNNKSRKKIKLIYFCVG